MKHLIIIIAILISSIAIAQTNYQKGMEKAFQLWQSDKWQEAEQFFERIATAEPNEWLPNYYIAQMNSLKSWEEKDANILKAQLDRAQEYINIATSISKNNPEIIVMQAQILTNWIAFDGMTYGMKYSAKVAELYNKAYAIDSDNPRVVYCKAEWGIGSARYFGQDTAPFCGELENALKLFTKFKPESDFHPNWGKKRAESAFENCK